MSNFLTTAFSSFISSSIAGSFSSTTSSLSSIFCFGTKISAFVCLASISPAEIAFSTTVKNLLLDSYKLLYSFKTSCFVFS